MNTYQSNVVTGATPNPVMPNPDAIDEEFIETANAVISNSVELIRQLIPCHQSAIAIIIDKNWNYVRKYFSLSEKYAAWAHYNTSAVGYGIHHWILDQNKTIRLTQAELDTHPQWKNFGTENSKHPPMRGWLATPIVDRQGKNWGLIQLSDRFEGDFTQSDEDVFNNFTKLVALALDKSWELRNFKKTAYNIS
jgi:GAF domain-containing protein